MVADNWFMLDPISGQHIYRIEQRGEHFTGQCLLCPFNAKPKSLHGARAGRATHIRWAHWDVYKRILDVENEAYMAGEKTSNVRRTLEVHHA